jgi:hypothetical protein
VKFLFNSIASVEDDVCDFESLQDGIGLGTAGRFGLDGMVDSSLIDVQQASCSVQKRLAVNNPRRIAESSY